MIDQTTPTSTHEAELITPIGRLGGPSYRYRGSKIDATDAEPVKWCLKSARHPSDRQLFASQEECMQLVDYWLDQD